VTSIPTAWARRTASLMEVCLSPSVPPPPLPPGPSTVVDYHYLLLTPAMPPPPPPPPINSQSSAPPPYADGLYLEESKCGDGHALYTAKEIKEGEIVTNFGHGSIHTLRDGEDVEDLQGLTDKKKDCVVRLPPFPLGRVLVITKDNREEIRSKSLKEFYACFAQHSTQLPNVEMVYQDGRAVLKALINISSGFSTNTQTLTKIVRTDIVSIYIYI